MSMLNPLPNSFGNVLIARPPGAQQGPLGVLVWYMGENLKEACLHGFVYILARGYGLKMFVMF